MVKIDLCDLAIKDFSTEEVISYIVALNKVARISINKGIIEQNLGLAGQASSIYSQSEALIEALDQKLNGKKEKTVVQ